MKCPRCSLDNTPQNRFCADCGTRLGSTADEASAPETLTLAFPEDKFRTGAVIAGRYQVIEELGRGGMGRVYKVLDQAVREKIALKVINPDIASHRSNLARFRNELKLARQITHRNVCRMYDLGEDEGVPFITMEFVAGENLRKIVRMTGPLTVETALSYAGQVCRGLAEAHKLGIVHRDLKPHNIMIDQEGTAKIMDFGLAFSAQGEDLTGPGLRVGTPRYMAPEQAERGESDARSDIFALGLILFEMVTGRLPFRGGSLDPLLRPRDLAPSLPAELETVILKCLERDPGRRFGTSAELLQALESLPSARRPSGNGSAVVSTGKTRKTGQRRPALFALAAALGALVLAGAAILILRPFPGRVSLAVLTFHEPVGEESRGSPAKSLADNIRFKLARLQGLKVISEHSSEQFSSDPLDAALIRRRLGVERIISGALHRQGSGFRLEVVVSDAAGKAPPWKHSYAIQPDEQFQVENDIVLDVAEVLAVPVGLDALDGFKLREPAVQEAYRYFKWGESFQEKYTESHSEADFSASLENYQKAVALDPRYALAYWGMGNLYEARYVLTSEAKDLIGMLSHYESAFKANPRLAEPYLGRGWAYFYEQEFDRAYASFREALRIDPDNPDVQLHVGSFLRSLGLFREAMKFYSASIRLNLDPLNTEPYFLMAVCHCWLGEFNKAIAVLSKALDLDPNSPSLHIALAWQYLHTGRARDARQEIEKAEHLAAGPKLLTRAKMWLLAIEGDREAALRLIPRVDYGFRYEITNAYCVLGMKDEAILNIAQGIDHGFRDIKEYLYSFLYLNGNSLYGPLRSDPRFQSLLGEQRRLYAERERRYGDL